VKSIGAQLRVACKPASHHDAEQTHQV